MKYLFFLALGMATATGFSQSVPKVGEVAPDFTGTDQDGKSITLSQLRGKKVVLYFYPKDGTPGCTAEAKSLRDRYADLTKAGYAVLGVSSDDEMSHKIFSKENSLPFSLISDPEKVIHMRYGVWVEQVQDGKKTFGTARTTFVIDANGKIEKIIDQVNTGEHAKQILGD